MNDKIQKSALIAMSGGVDSTVAAMLVLQEGYDCSGAIMKLHPSAKDAEPDARVSAETLGIPFYSLDLSEDFEKEVIARFITDYQQGRTPNPCVECNKRIKFGKLLEKASELKKHYLVTGHYAIIEQNGNGRYLLRKGADPKKDQSYVLFSLKQNQLSRVRFPLGCFTKSEVKELAQKANLPAAQRKESQDICFVPDGDYPRFIIEHIDAVPEKGRFIDSEGNELGEHKGLLHYTIGQRRGLGLSMPHPPYVVELRSDNNTVIIGKNEMLFSKKLTLRDINLIAIDRLSESIKANVKIRYNHKEEPATIFQTDPDTIQIEFEKPQRAITSGQAAVFYDGDYVLGGGTIV